MRLRASEEKAGKPLEEVEPGKKTLGCQRRDGKWYRSCANMAREPAVFLLVFVFMPMTLLFLSASFRSVGSATQTVVTKKVARQALTNHYYYRHFYDYYDYYFYYYHSISIISILLLLLLVLLSYYYDPRTSSRMDGMPLPSPRPAPKQPATSADHQFRGNIRVIFLRFRV